MMGPDSKTFQILVEATKYMENSLCPQTFSLSALPASQLCDQDEVIIT